MARARSRPRWWTSSTARCWSAASRPRTKAPDDACAGQFLSEAGRLLYRRPLTEPELKAQVGGRATPRPTSSAISIPGSRSAWPACWKSPQFLFREEIAEPDPDHAGEQRLDAYSKASRLSFFLWNTAPDDELLARGGERRARTRRAVWPSRSTGCWPRRGWRPACAPSSPTCWASTGSTTLAKDPPIYPKFTVEVAGRRAGADAAHDRRSCC